MSTGSSTQSAGQRNAHLFAFQWVASLSLLANMAFVVSAFFLPDRLRELLDLPSAAGEVWLRNAANLALTLAVFHIPAILEPARFTLYTWWVALMRFVEVLFWLVAIVLVPCPRGAIFLGPALVLGLIEVRLLRQGLAVRTGHTSRPIPDAAYADWFRLSVLLGFLADAAFIAGAFFAPQLLVKSMGMPPESADVWLRYTAALMTCINVMFLPAVIAPERSPLYSWWIPLMRFSGVLFWVWAMDLVPGLASFLFTDLALGVVQAFLLYRTLKGGPVAAAAA